MTKILYFSGDWCAPCRVLLPLVKDATRKYNVPLEVHDTEEDIDFAVRYNIIQLPTVIKCVDDVEVQRLVGLQAKYVVEKFVSAS